LAIVLAVTEPTPSSSSRILHRSRDDRVIAGVCGGLGHYAGVDPILLRVAFVVLAIGGGVGFIIYGLAWLVIPVEAPGEQPVTVARSSAAAGRVLVGTALIALGSIFLINRFVSWFGKIVGPITLIGIGVAVLVWGTRR